MFSGHEGKDEWSCSEFRNAARDRRRNEVMNVRWTSILHTKPFQKCLFFSSFFSSFYHDCELGILFIKLYRDMDRDLLKWWWTFYSPNLPSFFLLPILVWIGGENYESFFLPSQTKQALHIFKICEMFAPWKCDYSRTMFATCEHFFLRRQHFIHLVVFI